MREIILKKTHAHTYTVYRTTIVALFLHRHQFQRLDTNGSRLVIDLDRQPQRLHAHSGVPRRLFSLRGFSLTQCTLNMNLNVQQRLRLWTNCYSNPMTRARQLRAGLQESKTNTQPSVRCTANRRGLFYAPDVHQCEQRS